MTIRQKILGAAAIGLVVRAAYALWRSRKSEGAKEGQLRHFFGEASSTKELVDSFVAYVREDAPSNLKLFEDLRRDNPESALAEAVVFGLLQQLQLRPVISDLVGVGGADFLCTHRPLWLTDQGSWQLIVEATTMDLGAMERNSSWPNEISEEISGGAFSLLTAKIIERAAKKIPQLARHAMPRVLAIASSHVGSGALFSTLAAQSVLISEPKIRQPLDGSPAFQIVDLKDSAFLRWDDGLGKIVAQRESISAVLLVSIAGDRSSVLGILHPQPRYPLDISAFPDIPFIKIARWPIESGRIEVEWVVGQPTEKEFKHRLIKTSRTALPAQRM